LVLDVGINHFRCGIIHLLPPRKSG
jgi:hypothetical protein